MCGVVDHVQLMQNLDMHIIQFRNNEEHFIQRREIQIKLKFNLYGCHFGGKHSLFSFAQQLEAIFGICSSRKVKLNCMGENNPSPF